MNCALETLLANPPERVAPQLIGWTILTAFEDTLPTGGIICETEAYLAQNDPAAHSKRGRTKATRSLYRRAGTVYVHRMRQHTLVDIVTEGENTPSAVLIRRLQPTLGLELMAARRGVTLTNNLCNGPGNLCKALGITKAVDGTYLLDPDCPIRLIPPVAAGGHTILTSARIGVTSDLTVPLRFYAVMDGV